MTDRKPIDWERIEAQYRAGKMSLRAIAMEHDVTEGAIRKRAKRDGWERDLTAKVDAKVRNALVRSAVRNETAEERLRTEKQVVDEAADTQTGVVRSHRRTLARRIEMTTVLEEQLMLAIGSRDIFQSAIEEMTADDKTPQRYNALMRAVALPTHIVAMKDLATATRTLIGLERQAYGLADVEDPTPPEATQEASPAQEALDAARDRLIKRLESTKK